MQLNIPKLVANSLFSNYSIFI